MISLSFFEHYTPVNVFLLQGRSETFVSLVKELQKEKISHIHIHCTSLTIDNARELRTIITDLGEGESWALVSFTFFTSEARDVFLKLLEEPYQGVHIVLCTPYPYLVPDTIRSRVLFISEYSSQKYEKDFFTLSLSQKLEYIKKHFGEDSEDDAGGRREEAFVLLDEYEKRIHEEKRFMNADVFFEAKKMIYLSQLSPKQVLEYVVTILG